MRHLKTDDPVAILQAEVTAMPAGHERRLIAIAGPPASGKSTIAAALVSALNYSGDLAALVPMDGFHLDNSVLTDRGILHRKGAPQTIDAAGFVNAVSRLSAGKSVFLPSFDRHRDFSVAGAIHVSKEHRIIVLEGNYLCYEKPPWCDLAQYWDMAVYLDIPVEILRQRLLKRWLDIGLSQAEAAQKVQGNDLPNATEIQDHRSGMDLLLKVSTNLH